MPAAASESRDGRGRPRLRRSMAARMAASDVAADEAVRRMCGGDPRFGRGRGTVRPLGTL